MGLMWLELASNRSCRVFAIMHRAGCEVFSRLFLVMIIVLIIVMREPIVIAVGIAIVS